VLLVQGREEMAVLLPITAVPLHHFAIDIYVLTVVLLVQCRGKCRFWLQLLQYCYITVLWIHELTVVLVEHGRSELAVLPTVTAVLLHHSAMDIWTDCSVVSTR
jgi:hypothetical protein